MKESEMKIVEEEINKTVIGESKKIYIINQIRKRLFTLSHKNTEKESKK